MSWRDTLFCWRGVVRDRAWSGTWEGSDTLDLPPVEAYGASQQSFTARRVQGDVGLVTGEWTSTYALNVSTTKRARFVSKAEGPYPLLGVDDDKRVLGRGHNEFGAFVIHGTIDEESVMTLCRRYVDDDDVRASMSPVDLAVWPRERVLAIGHVTGHHDGEAGQAKKARLLARTETGD